MTDNDIPSAASIAAARVAIAANDAAALKAIQDKLMPRIIRSINAQLIAEDPQNTLVLIDPKGKTCWSNCVHVYHLKKNIQREIRTAYSVLSLQNQAYDRIYCVIPNCFPITEQFVDACTQSYRDKGFTVTMRSSTVFGETKEPTTQSDYWILIELPDAAPDTAPFVATKTVVDIPTAYALVNPAVIVAESVTPPMRHWWWPFAPSSSTTAATAISKVQKH